MLEQLNMYAEMFANEAIDQYKEECTLPDGIIEGDKLLFKMKNHAIGLMDKFMKKYNISLNILFGEKCYNEENDGIFVLDTDEPELVELLDELCRSINDNNYLVLIMQSTFEKREIVSSNEKKQYKVSCYDKHLNKLTYDYPETDIVFSYVYFYFVSQSEKYIEMYFSEPVK